MRHQQEVQQHGKNGKHACSKFLLPLSRAGLARIARTVSFEKGSAMRRRRWVGGAAESTEIWKPFALKTSDTRREGAARRGTRQRMETAEHGKQQQQRQGVHMKQAASVKDSRRSLRGDSAGLGARI